MSSFVISSRKLNFQERLCSFNKAMFNFLAKKKKKKDWGGEREGGRDGGREGRGKKHCRGFYDQILSFVNTKIFM